MAPKLTKELRHAIAKQPGRPVRIEDPETHTFYVLVQLDAFERLERAVDYDASEPDPRTFYPAFAEAVKHQTDSLPQA